MSSAATHPHTASNGEAPLPGSARLLVAAVALAGLGLLISAAFSAGHVDWTALIALAVLAILAERFDFNLYNNSTVSLAFVPIFAAIALFGFLGLAVVAPLAVFLSAIGVDRPLYKTAFNFGALMLSGTASVVVLEAFGAAGDPGAWPEVIVVACLAAQANYFVNSALIATAISLTSKVRLREVWNEHFLWLWPHYLILGFLGLAIASAHEGMGLWGIAVFVAPPVMMRLTVKQYLDRTTEGVLEIRKAHGELQTAHSELRTVLRDLDKAYDGTLHALVAALDARDSETGGHSSRVADLTAAIAAEMGIPRDSEQSKIIAWGALLHDVGKIAVPDAILRKPGRLTDDEWVIMRSHARAGFEIVQGVEFLAPAADMVLAHHERYDGAGYPRGLAGEEVPLGARIFMIADTFDAITSERPYKPAIAPEEALAEILRCSGTQFDPACVRAFLTVYQQRFVTSRQKDTPRGLDRLARQQLNDAVATGLARPMRKKEN